MLAGKHFSDTYEAGHTLNNPTFATDFEVASLQKSLQFAHAPAKVESGQLHPNRVPGGITGHRRTALQFRPARTLPDPKVVST